MRTLSYIFLILTLLRIGRTENVKTNIKENCNNSCQNTYNDTTSCNRGCRFYSISEWTTLSDNSSDILKVCNEACNEAYYEANEQSLMCLSGCDKAAAISKINLDNNKEILQSNQDYAEVGNFFGVKESQETNIPEFFQQPMMKEIDNMMREMMQFAAGSLFLADSSHTRTEVIEILDGKHHEVIFIEFGPEINTPADKKLFPNTDTLGSKTTLEDRVESNIPSFLNRLKPRNNFEFSEEEWDRHIQAFPNVGHYWSGFLGQVEDWWDCFSKKAGLPELVLAIFWLSIIFILMLTCCIQFKPNKKLSINGDLSFIRDTKGNLPSYMQTYPSPAYCKKSPYYQASVLESLPSYEKDPLLVDLELE